MTTRVADLTGARRACPERLLTRDLLRQATTDLATAQLLERRAERSSSPGLAGLLRERAGERRRRAERLRSAAGPDPLHRP